MAVRKILEIGDPALKLDNKTIRDFGSSDLKLLIRSLKDTMIKTDLIGIAAPQIGVNRRVFLTNPKKTKFRKLPKSDGLRIYINPRMVFQSKETSLIYEGCGCLPERSVFGPVVRPKEIEVEAYDARGKKFRLRCNGILARVIQHEYDHLQGIEFLERVKNNRMLISWNIYNKTVRNSAAQLSASDITVLEFKPL